MRVKIFTVLGFIAAVFCTQLQAAERTLGFGWDIPDDVETVRITIETGNGWLASTVWNAFWGGVSDEHQEKKDELRAIANLKYVEIPKNETETASFVIRHMDEIRNMITVKNGKPSVKNGQELNFENSLRNLVVMISAAVSYHEHGLTKVSLTVDRYEERKNNTRANILMDGDGAATNKLNKEELRKRKEELLKKRKEKK